MIENGRVLAVDRDTAQRVEGFPCDAGRIGDPILVRLGVATGLLVLLEQARVSRLQLTVHGA